MLLAGLAGILAPTGLLTPGTAAAAPAPLLRIRPRLDWAQGLEPVGRLEAEPDVRFLLVHHTASRNTYARGEVRAELRSFFRYHTGSDKGWPDLAYNFMIDRFGDVWEGRTGSAAGPIQTSATGGSQGFAQLACYIGDLAATPPTAAARSSMLRLLAMLADRHDLDTRPGTKTSFVSRGSNRWPEGTRVSARTISGHRDMSMTTCPGDAAYADLRDNYARDVTALRVQAAAGSRPTGTPTAAGSAAAAPSPRRRSAAPTRAPSAAGPRPSGTPGTAAALPRPAGGTPGDQSPDAVTVAAGAAVAAAAGALAAVGAAYRRGNRH